MRPVVRDDVTNFDDLKALAESLDRPLRDLIALSRNNDPFYINETRGEWARWFGKLWRRSTNADAGTNPR